MGRTSVLIGGTAFGQLVGLLVYPILTRVYTPAEIGTLAVYTSALGIVAVVASLRYEQAIPLPEKEVDATALLVLSLVIAVLVAILTMIVLWFAPGLVGGELSPLDSALVHYALPVGVLLLATYQALSMMAMRVGLYPQVGITRAVQGTVAGGIQVAGGLLGFGTLGLILGHVLGQSSGSVNLALSLRKRDFGEGARWRRMMFVARRYARFASIGMPSALLNTLALLLPVVLVARLFSIEIAGYLSLAILVLSAPVQLVGRSNAQVFFAEASKVWKSDPSAARGMLSKTTRRLVAFSTIPAVLAVIFAPLVFPWLFGSTWLMSGEFVSILTATYFMAMISAPASQAFLLAERQEISLGLNVMKLIVTIIAFLIAPLMGLTIFAAVWIFAVGMIVYYGLVVVLAYSVIGRKMGRGKSS